MIYFSGFQVKNSNQDLIGHTQKVEVIDFAGFVSYIELFVLKNKTSSFGYYYGKGTFASGVLMRPVFSVE